MGTITRVGSESTALEP